MFLRDAVAAAVGISYLLLMVAYQPVKACSCLPATDKQNFCRAEELVKLTVMSVKNVQRGSESSSSGFVQYKVRIDKVFKSMTGVTARRKVYLKTPLSNPACALQLSSGRRYLLSASLDSGVLYANACSWVKEWDSLHRKVKKLLKGEVKPKCARDTKAI